MITLKTGTPGAGKTLSMVAELMTGDMQTRPLYTNITGLKIPHIPLVNWVAGETERKPGVLYTTDWQQCPPGAIIVIDEAFLYGYDARSAGAAVPIYIRDLAVHRKDYSVDIWFIAQSPKLLNVALRRQVGKHQHYRRMFGWGTAMCYEWDQCQDNLSATKTAVVSRFKYPRNVFQAYISAQEHTKPVFKKPWFIWIPVALIPLAAWALPTGYNVMSGAMTGKGIGTTQTPPKPAAAASAPVAAAPLAPFKPDPLPPGFEPPSPDPLLPPPGQLVQAPVVAGCIATSVKGCKCFDAGGKVVPTVPEMCPDTSAKPASDLAMVRDTPMPAVVAMQTTPLSLGGGRATTR